MKTDINSPIRNLFKNYLNLALTEEELNEEQKRIESITPNIYKSLEGYTSDLYQNLINQADGIYLSLDDFLFFLKKYKTRLVEETFSNKKFIELMSGVNFMIIYLELKKTRLNMFIPGVDTDIVPDIKLIHTPSVNFRHKDPSGFWFEVVSVLSKEMEKRIERIEETILHRIKKKYAKSYGNNGKCSLILNTTNINLDKIDCEFVYQSLRDDSNNPYLKIYLTDFPFASNITKLYEVYPNTLFANFNTKLKPPLYVIKPNRFF